MPETPTADLVGAIMDKAAAADRRALFAALQAALGGMTNLSYRQPVPELEFRRVLEALEVGAPVGSPEQLAHLERKAAAVPPPAAPEDCVVMPAERRHWENVLGPPRGD